MAATRRVRHSSSQPRMLRSGGWSSTRAGIARKRSAAGMLPSCSPASLAMFHSSIPWSASQSRPPNGMPGPLEALRPLGERVGGEAEAAGVPHRPRDLARVEAAVPDLRVDPEGEVVVALQRRHLLAGEQQHVAVPALLAVPLRRERVVVGEQHHVGARPRRRARDLPNGPGAVGVRRVEVDHTGEVVHSHNFIAGRGFPRHAVARARAPGTRAQRLSGVGGGHLDRGPLLRLRPELGRRGHAVRRRHRAAG